MRSKKLKIGSLYYDKDDNSYLIPLSNAYKNHEFGSEVALVLTYNYVGDFFSFTGNNNNRGFIKREHIASWIFRHYKLISK